MNSSYTLYYLANLSVYHFIDGVDFIGVTQKISFTGSGETHCINISILKDSVNEFDEHFLLDLTLLYTAFDIPLQQINITILDSGELSINNPFPGFSNNDGNLIAYFRPAFCCLQKFHIWEEQQGWEFQFSYCETSL